MKIISSLTFFLTMLLMTSTLNAEINEKRVEYYEGQAKLVGYEYSSSEMKGETPGVIIFSNWLGVGDFAKNKAKELVKDGYRVFVADIYGDGKFTTDMKEAGELAGKFKGDRPLFQKRTRAAYDTFLKNKSVDPKRVAAIGFCFGGTASLELARSGTPLAGLVSFHGGLSTDNLTQGKNIKGKVLILHGADDPLVPETEVQAFEKEMNDGKVNWELVKYSGTVHSFTDPDAGNDPSKGFAYNELSAKRAFLAMDNFLEEIFD